jgi:hypothetical protein
VADQGLLAEVTTVYRAVRDGALPASALTTGDVFLAAALPDMSHRPQPGASGQEILMQMCRQCHNSRLDQSIGRARFNVERLDTLSPSVIEEAKRRIQLPADHARLMPPRRFRELSEDEVARVIAVLEGL